MKHAITAIALCLVPISAFGFIPKTQVPVSISTDSIYLTDITSQKWKTKTDCLFDLQANSEVKVKSLEKRRFVRSNQRLLVDIDGKKQICRIIKLSTI